MPRKTPTFPAQQPGRRDVPGVADGLMLRPDPLVVGHLAVTGARTRARSAVTSIRRPITEGWTE